MASTEASSVPTPQGSFIEGAIANSDVCETGLNYACGDTGPGGGVVFYASATAFACGADLASACNFLEVAPNLWDPNSQSSCPGNNCGGSTQQTSDLSGTGDGITECTGADSSTFAGPSDTAIGTGNANTSAWISACNAEDAPNVARAYPGGGMTDWSLPSRDELQALYFYPGRDAIGGFVASRYWSSSSTKSGYATEMYFSGAETGGTYNDNTVGMTIAVRPVRAF